MLWDQKSTRNISFPEFKLFDLKKRGKRVLTEKAEKVFLSALFWMKIHDHYFYIK